MLLSAVGAPCTTASILLIPTPKYGGSGCHASENSSLAGLTNTYKPPLIGQTSVMPASDWRLTDFWGQAVLVTSRPEPGLTEIVRDEDNIYMNK